jgi:hypothetical protein
MLMNVYACATLAVSMILAVLPGGPVQAGDSLVIWSPARTSDNAYRLRMGARRPTTADMSAGVDVSVTTSSTGRIRDTRDNARLWAEMRGQAGADAVRSATAGYNPLTGRVSANVVVSRRWVASSSFDVVFAPSVSADTNVRHGYGGSVRMTQKARLEALRTGTSLIAAGTAASGNDGIDTELGLEQRVFERLDLGASVKRHDAGVVGALRARLRFDW